jgi:MFS family permease
MIQAEIQKNVRYNTLVGISEALFFGLAMGFVATSTIIPLFLDTLTDNTAIIGLISSIHVVGWQLPQILTANRVAKLARYKPMVLKMTIHERWPYFALVVVALLIPKLSATIILSLAFIFLTIQALGGGFTGTAWQSMLGKVIPQNRRGSFFGMQSAGANLFAAASGPMAGVILVKVAYPYNFALCFFFGGFWMIVSWAVLALTREPERETFFSDENGEDEAEKKPALGWSHFGTIWRGSSNFRFFVLARFFAQFARVGIAFYTIYGVRHLGMNEANAGILFSVLTLSSTVANPILGWFGDRWGHRRAFAAGVVAMGMSTVSALLATSVAWLYLAFIFAGVGGAAIWTIAMTMTIEFGTEEDRPYYIGMTNTLIAPATLFAPFIGGLLADAMGFDATFTLGVVACILTVFILLFVVDDPQQQKLQLA